MDRQWLINWIGGDVKLLCATATASHSLHFNACSFIFWILIHNRQAEIRPWCIFFFFSLFCYTFS